MTDQSAHTIERKKYNEFVFLGQRDGKQAVLAEVVVDAQSRDEADDVMSQIKSILVKEE